MFDAKSREQCRGNEFPTLHGPVDCVPAGYPPGPTFPSPRSRRDHQRWSSAATGSVRPVPPGSEPVTEPSFADEVAPGFATLSGAYIWMFGGACAVYLRRLARSPSRMVLKPASYYSAGSPWLRSFA